MPFDTEQFFDVFRRYNEAVWPAQLLLYLLAAVALVSAWRSGTLYDPAPGAPDEETREDPRLPPP